MFASSFRIAGLVAPAAAQPCSFWRHPRRMPITATTRSIEDARIRHARTLHAIDISGHGIQPKVRWRDINALVQSLGGHVRGRRVSLPGEKEHLLHVHGASDVQHHAFATMSDMAELRDLFYEAGILCGDHGSSEGDGAGEQHPACLGLDNRWKLPSTTYLVTISSAEARIFEAPFAPGSQPVRVIFPAETPVPGQPLHLHAKAGVAPGVTPLKGDYARPSVGFLREVARAVRGGAVVIAGHGHGKSNAGDELIKAHPELRVIGRIRTLEGGQGGSSTNELLAAARGLVEGGVPEEEEPTVEDADYQWWHSM